MSISSFSASFRACMEGRTWNRSRWRLRLRQAGHHPRDLTHGFVYNIHLDFLVESFIKESDNASTDPSTSPLTMMLSSLKLPMAILRPISSRVICFCVADLVHAAVAHVYCDFLGFFFAFQYVEFVTCLRAPVNREPAQEMKVPLPRSVFHVHCTWLSRAGMIACQHDVAYPEGAGLYQQGCNVTAPLSSEDSITVPVACLLGLAFRSSNSASSNTLSSKVETLRPVLAEISCDWYLPPSPRQVCSYWQGFFDLIRICVVCQFY